MVFDGPICALFDAVDIGTLSARERALCDFGPSALLVHTQENKPMADATETFKFRLPLRQIAKALGKVEKELDAIRMTVPQLQDLIKPDVANIADMSFDEVTALAAELASGNRPSATPTAPKQAPVAKSEPAAPQEEAAPAPAKRGPGRPPKPKTPTVAAPAQEVVEEEAAPVSEEPVVAKVINKPGPKLPVRRPVTDTAPVQAAPVQQVESSVPVGDFGVVLSALEDLRKRIDIIGQQSDLINKEVAALRTDVKRVEQAFGVQDDRITAIVGALSFLYATASGDEDPESIENIDWSQFLG